MVFVVCPKSHADRLSKSIRHTGPKAMLDHNNVLMCCLIAIKLHEDDDWQLRAHVPCLVAENTGKAINSYKRGLVIKKSMVTVLLVVRAQSMQRLRFLIRFNMSGELPYVYF